MTVKKIFKNQNRKSTPRVQKPLEFIGKRIEEVRFSMGLTQVDIERLCVEKKLPYIVSANLICMVENGLRLPTLQALNAFIDVTGMTFSEFFEGF